MAGRTIDIEEMITGSDGMAEEIAQKYTEWSMLRDKWVEEKKELRNYIFQTDTTKTTNGQLPWKNSTTTPKICQIRDNLHANYISALFPHDEWLTWAAEDKEGVKKDKRDMIEGYMRNKTRLGRFKGVIEDCLLDWIDTGNCVATTEYVDRTKLDPETGEEIPGYVGPIVRRMSPLQVVFNPLAPTFEEAPKIVRTVTTLGELKSRMEEEPNSGYLEDVFKVVRENREKVKGISVEDAAISDGFIVDGFSSIHHYYTSGYVEILEFVGDMYDMHTEEFFKDHIITVVDRRHVIRKKPNPIWRGDGIRHIGWRKRPDNLYGMGPLDNLVGMQYRIDHLENLSADVFDQYAYPMIKIRGFVEDFDIGPNERIYLGDDGDVDLLRPEALALSADNKIERLELKMEEMAGAPKQAMGIRTPGEKTAFEVNRLENAAGRIFQAKITAFEVQFLEPLLNDMLELSRRALSGNDFIKVIDDKKGTQLFQEITKDDLVGVGNVYPTGARHFAAKATLVQNLTQLAGSPIGQDPAVNVHISGLGTAKLMEDLLDLEKWQLVRENIRVEENHKTQSFINNLQQDLNAESEELGLGVPGDEAGIPVDLPPEGQEA